ncbi:hypothetical protein JOE11_002074 [Robbsia andropogonis]
MHSTLHDEKMTLLSKRKFDDKNPMLEVHKARGYLSINAPSTPRRELANKISATLFLQRYKIDANTAAAVTTDLRRRTTWHGMP